MERIVYYRYYRIYRIFQKTMAFEAQIYSSDGGFHFMTGSSSLEDVKAVKTGRRNYEVWASFFSADSRKIGKVMVKVVPESSLLLT